MYLRTGEEEFRPLFWMQNNKPNEMLLGFYGLSGSTPILKRMWPVQTLNTSELAKVRYDNASAIETDTLLDHVTCHADGRFHLKTKDGSDVYIQAMQRTAPLGPDTSVFLEVIICSDLARQYAAKRVKYPNIWFGIQSDQYLVLRAIFAGINHDTERVMIATMAQFKGTHGGMALTSGTLKGLIMGHPVAPSSEAIVKRHKGTLISFKFPLVGEKWHIKTFLLA